jgi:Phytanoyl-CoA dioxygenase (PhyH)
MSQSSGSAVATAEQLFAAGDVYEALHVLADTNRVAHDPALEELLVQLSHEGFRELRRRAIEFVPPSRSPDPVGPLTELAPADLTPATLRHGLSEHGCVLIRELVPPARVAGLVTGIDRALGAFDAGIAGTPVEDTRPWYVPFEPAAGEYRVGGRRNWVRKGGAMWTADSPRMFFELLELLDEIGIGRLVTEYLGERPALSANKCTLRRTPAGPASGDWHQDGAFLGTDVRSVNFWLALAHCGRDAPGLDIVPRRMERVLPTGTGGANFDWAVGPDVVREACGRNGIVRPEFGPGDALLFDHLFVHRTASEPHMTAERHAMETWLFAPSTYPQGQIPLVY